MQKLFKKLKNKYKENEMKFVKTIIFFVSVLFERSLIRRIQNDMFCKREDYNWNLIQYILGLAIQKTKIEGLLS